MQYLKAEILFLLIFVTDYIRTELDPDGKNVCLTTENYQETVMVRTQKQKTEKKWCWRGRCAKTKLYFEDEPRVFKRTRIVAKCCDGYREETGQSDCVPACLKGCKNGKCIAPDICACDPGFHGLKCDKECSEGWWGVNCVNKCTCSDNEKCNKEKGCECKPGWTGDRCDLPCQEGYYGYSCEKKCKCDLACNHITGECTINTVLPVPSAARNYDVETSTNGYRTVEKDQVAASEETERKQNSVSKGTERNQVSVSEEVKGNLVSVSEGTERSQYSESEETERNQVSVSEGTEKSQHSESEETERNQVSVSEGTQRSQHSESEESEETERNQVSVAEGTEGNQVSVSEGTQRIQASVSEGTERSQHSESEETERNQVSVSEGAERNQIAVSEFPVSLKTKIFTEVISTTEPRWGEGIDIEDEINPEIGESKETELSNSVTSTTQVTNDAVSVETSPRAITEPYATYISTSEKSKEATEVDVKFRMQNEINFLKGLETFVTNATIKYTEETEYTTEINTGNIWDTTIINNKTFWITFTNTQQPDGNETDNLINSEKGSASTDYLNTKFHFFASLSILTGISLVIFVIAAKWIIVSHKRRVQKILITQKEKILHTEQGKDQTQNFFSVSGCAENPVYLSDVDMNKAVPILQTFKPVN